MLESRQAGYIPHAGEVVDAKPSRATEKASFTSALVGRISIVREIVWEVFKAVALSLVYFRATPVRLRGTEKSGGGELSVLYIGTKLNLEFVKNNFLVNASEERLGSSVSPFRARSLVRKYQSVDDALILDLPWPASHWLRRPGELVLPPWIGTVILLPDTWDAVVANWSKNVKNVELRRIRKHELTYRLVGSKSDFENFYQNYYVPYIKQRFGNEAYVEPRRNVMALRKHAEILEILRGEQVISAALLIDDGQYLGFPWIGSPVGLDRKQSEGAFAGLYYYITRIAFERGLKGVNCFYTRPLLGDGVLKYKRRWGAKLDEHVEIIGHLLFRPLVESEPLYRCLQENPPICCETEGYAGRCLIADEPLTTARLQECLNNYLVPGLSRLDVYALQGLDAALDIPRSVDSTRIEVTDLSQYDKPLQVWSGCLKTPAT